jgi:hypothetical protein
VSELDVRCTTVADLGTRYLEGALSESQQTAYETHLVYCASCASFLTDMRDLHRRLEALPVDSVDEAERQAIVADAAEAR